MHKWGRVIYLKRITFYWYELHTRVEINMIRNWSVLMVTAVASPGEGCSALGGGRPLGQQSFCLISDPGRQTPAAGTSGGGYLECEFKIAHEYLGQEHPFRHLRVVDAQMSWSLTRSMGVQAGGALPKHPWRLIPAQMSSRFFADHFILGWLNTCTNDSWSSNLR